MSFALASILILVLARVVPIRGGRRIAAVLLRLLGVWCLALALRGFVARHEERPRHLVYLMDQSASIDAGQTHWMAQRLASLEAIRPRQISRAVLVFSQQARVLFPTERAPLTDPDAIAQALGVAPIARDATNLEAAILATLSATSRVASGGEADLSQQAGQGRDRVILFSDGRQTTGDVEQILTYLRRLGLEVYPIAVPPTEPTGFVWEQVAVPPVVRRGASVPIKLLFSNMTTQPQPVEITVNLQNLPLTRRQQQLPPGWQVVSLSVPALKTGTMALEVSVASLRSGQPTDQDRQRRKVVVEVEGPPHLLLVLEKPTELPLLATALKHRDMEFAVATPRELPTDVWPLLDNDAVVLFHVPKSSLNQAQVEALAQYVERFGGGVVMVGLGGKLDQELAHDAPLDQLLPVRFEPKGLQESKRRVCMVMLIDRSASMMGPRIAATKRAAVELVKQLAPDDLVGVLAFDTVPYVVAEVQPASQVSAGIIEKLVRLKSTGGTDILPALKAAQTRLESSGATVKHIILLSDGNTTFNAKAYTQLMSELRQERITMSTIGIGSAFVNVELMDWLATGTGGTFYQMRTLDELPQLIARDTQNSLGELPFTEGYFRPLRSPASEWFEDITGWPSLKGYLTATAKPGARVELGIHQPEGEDPLLAQWAVGLGRVTSFTSDADTRWSPDWIRWPQFENVWAQAVRQTMRRRPTEELFVWLDHQTDSPQLIIEGQLLDPTAELVSDTDHTIPLALVQVSPFRWRASVDHVPSNWYQVVVESHQPLKKSDGKTQTNAPEGTEGSSPVAFARRWIQIGHASGGPEQQGLPPDEALLRRIAQATNGLFNAPDRAFLPPTQRVTHSVPLRGRLLPLVLVLLLIEVAIRGRTML